MATEVHLKKMKMVVEESSTTRRISENLKLPDDLFSEIMIRCDLHTVHKCKCVYRDWNRILSSSSFCLANISHHQPPLLGFFHFNLLDDEDELTSIRDEEIGSRFTFLPTYPGQGDQFESFHSLAFLNKINKGDFLCVSNGLVLCGENPNLHVFNPITKQIFSLPTTDIIPQKFSFLAGSPSLISSQFHNDFKVIVPFHKTGLLYKTCFHVYCSKNKLWTRVILSAAAHFKMSKDLIPNSFNGTCFWFAMILCVNDRKRRPGKGQRIPLRAKPCETTKKYDKLVVAYNPDRNPKHVHLIKLPFSGVHYQIPSFCQSSHGYLQCVIKDGKIPGFRVHILPKSLASYGYDKVIEHSEWVLTHELKLDMKDPVWTRPGVVRDYPPCPRFVVQEGFHPANPRILFMRRGSRIFSIDVETLEMNEISYKGYLVCDNKKIVLWPYVQLPPWPPLP